MRSEGYGSCRVGLSVILSVMRELTSPVIDRVKNKLTYPAADGGQKICGIKLLRCRAQWRIQDLREGGVPKITRMRIM